MKNLLIVVAIIATCALADNFSDDPQKQPEVKENVLQGLNFKPLENAPQLNQPPTGHACDPYLLETYQFTVDQKGIMEVWNCCRYVGRVKMDFDNPHGLDSLILADNL